MTHSSTIIKNKIRFKGVVMIIKKREGLRMKDFLRLPDRVRIYISILAEEHGMSLKKYLKKIKAEGIEWGDKEFNYKYVPGEGVIKEKNVQDEPEEE